MSLPSGAQRASRRAPARYLAGLILLAAFLGVGAALTGPAPALAATGPKVAIIVGPAGSQTSTNRDWASAAAKEALRYTTNVVQVSTPNATWSRVKSAISGAAVVVYVGRGRGFPSPYSSSLNTYTEDGFGLNPIAGVNNSTTKYYGESYVRTVRLAPGALVLLHHLAYASGNSEPGRTQPTLSVARRRVDNYGAGFLAAGASVVIAEARYPATYYIRSVFTKDIALDTMWRTAPTYRGHVTSFTSTRTRGAIGRTDPLYATSGYYRSIVGWPATLTTTVREAGLARTAPPSGIAVPSSIDPTGRTNVSASLNAWLASVPDGSTVVFKAGGIYLVEPGLRLYNRKNLVLEGNGATIRNVGWGRSALAFWAGANITVRNLTLLGNNIDAGTAKAYHWGGREFSAGLQLYGASNVEIANVTTTGAWGDCLFVGVYGPDRVWSNAISFHDSTCALNGRHGVTINGGSRVTVERVRFDQIAMYVLDIEPDYTDEGATAVRFISNQVGTYTVSTIWDCLFVAADGVAGSPVSDLTISGNSVSGNPRGYRGKACGLNTDISVPRRRNIVFTNNTATLAVAGPVLRFAHIDGLTVTGNVQPLSSGVLASITDCTGVTLR